MALKTQMIDFYFIAFSVKNTRCSKTHHMCILAQKTASPLYRGGFSLGPVVNSWLMKSRCWN